MNLESEQGFTLVELLVVVGIIGILSAIAIPQYASYRERAYNTRAESDIRNAISAQEALFADTESYAACSGSGCNDPVLPGFVASDGVDISFEIAVDGSSFSGSSNHSLGTLTYTFDSTEGVINKSSGGDGGDGGGGDI